MLTVSPSMAVRSSLESMLESLRQQDEQQFEQQRDIPPALPSRPMSRARLPPSRRFIVPGADVAEVAKAGVSGSGDKIKKIGASEESTNQALQSDESVILFQKCYRGYKARSQFAELKDKASILQSFIRGEYSRRKYASLLKHQRDLSQNQKNKHKHICNASKALQEQQKAIIRLQSVVRGWLARKHLDDRQTSEDSNVIADRINQLPNETAQMKVPQNAVEVLKMFVERAQANLAQKEEENATLRTQLQQYQIRCSEHDRVSQNALEELKRCVERAKENLVQKEEENATLRTELQQYKIRCSEHDTKMRSMEYMLQKQIASLQMSLAEARKSISPVDAPSQPGKQESSPPPLSDELDDDLLVGPPTPGETTPTKSSNAIDEPSETNGGGLNPINLLAKEFEQKRRVFNEDARTLLNYSLVKSPPGMNYSDELSKLKLRFEMWKREYKIRLRETKAALHKLTNGNSEKNRHKWWKFGGKKH